MTQGPSYMFEKFMICFVSFDWYIFTDYINSTKNVAWDKDIFERTQKKMNNSFTFALHHTSYMSDSPNILLSHNIRKMWRIQVPQVLRLPKCPGIEYCSPLSSLKLVGCKVPFLPLFWDDYCYQQQTGMPLRSFYDATDSTTSTELSRDWIVLWVKR